MKTNEKYTLEDFTLESCKKALIFKRISFISKILLLMTIPVLIFLFNKLSQAEIVLYSIVFLSLVILYIFSTRKYNFLNIQIQTNFWLSDMVKNPPKFNHYVQKNNL
jgi:hypothetical protein